MVRFMSQMAMVVAGFGLVLALVAAGLVLVQKVSSWPKESVVPTLVHCHRQYQLA